MTTELTLDRVYGCDSPLADVIFVHGLTGDPCETWTASNTDDFWPNWLEQDFPRIAVYTLGYPASALAKPANPEMTLFERSGNVLENLSALGIGHRPIIFVAHSLGGLLVKIILRKSSESIDPDWHAVSDATKLVAFLSTPHDGSTLANVFKCFPLASHHIHLLANKTGYLPDLNAHYRSLSHSRPDLATVVYYETRLTSALLVVPPSSADPGITDVDPIPLDKDHKTICKPRDTDDLLYLSLKHRIRRLLASNQNPASPNEPQTYFDDYNEKSSDDRRDLHQKLIDAGREHEYSIANNAQNRFARHYASTGLLKAAREDHENLLSELETRFITHVYHPLICQAASDAEVRDALQRLVLDPLTDKPVGGTRFPAKSVFNALYFLTEQCYIRWDMPQ